MMLDTKAFYDRSEYSDVVIKFSDREVRCHKIILCEKSEYFKTLCGPGSHFAESKQSTIELKEDDPDALQAILLYLYTGQHGSDRDGDWAFQLELSKTAKKYLCPDLSKLATRKFQYTVQKISNVETVYSTIKHIRQHAHEPEDLSLADTLEQQHLFALTKLPDYRDLLSQDPTRLQNCLEALTTRVNVLTAHISEVGQMRVETCGKQKCKSAVQGLKSRLTSIPTSSSMQNKKS